jgi:hypothetical protein
MLKQRETFDPLKMASDKKYQEASRTIRHDVVAA